MGWGVLIPPYPSPITLKPIKNFSVKSLDQSQIWDLPGPPHIRQKKFRGVTKPLYKFYPMGKIGGEGNYDRFAPFYASKTPPQKKKKNRPTTAGLMTRLHFDRTIFCCCWRFQLCMEARLNRSTNG